MFLRYNSRMEPKKPKPPKNPGPLNTRQKEFIRHLRLDPHRVATRAYEKAYDAKGMAASVNASRLLTDPRVQAEIDRQDRELGCANKLEAAEIFMHLHDLATADPRDLMEYHRGACRYCWGAGHRYQMTAAELEKAIAEYKASSAGKKDPVCAFFDYKGGVGFRRKREPNPACPECEGDGVGYTHVRDTRTVPAAAARLFAGIKETRDGFEVKTRSQDKALELAMRAAGMFSERKTDDETTPPPVAVTYMEQDASAPAAPQQQDAKA